MLHLNIDNNGLDNISNKILIEALRAALPTGTSNRFSNAYVYTDNINEHYILADAVLDNDIILNARINLNENNDLISIEFIGEDTWVPSKLDEMYINNAVETLDTITQTSPWFIRQNLIDDIYGSISPDDDYYDDEDDDSFNSSEGLEPLSEQDADYYNIKKEDCINDYSVMNLELMPLFTKCRTTILNLLRLNHTDSYSFNEGTIELIRKKGHKTSLSLNQNGNKLHYDKMSWPLRISLLEQAVNLIHEMKSQN